MQASAQSWQMRYCKLLGPPSLPASGRPLRTRCVDPYRHFCTLAPSVGVPFTGPMKLSPLRRQSISCSAALTSAPDRSGCTSRVQSPSRALGCPATGARSLAERRLALACWGGRV
jgi:hypothetical protein